MKFKFLVVTLFFVMFSVTLAAAAPRVHDTFEEDDLSAEQCLACHNGYYDAWNESSNSGFDMETMASHSAPAESYSLVERECISCKSSNGAIVNLEKEGIYDLNEEAIPESPAEMAEWVTEERITCFVCHDPQRISSLRVEDGTVLCANCHNSHDIEPDGVTNEVHHPQWEMYSDSEYVAEGDHRVELECSDCHMAVKPSRRRAGGAATGHTFDFDAKALSTPGYSNGCYRCHKGNSLQALVENDQKKVSDELEGLDYLQARATEALEVMNGTPRYDEYLDDYNNALFYKHFVEADGSMGVHNPEKSLEYLDESEALFNMVIEAETGSFRGTESQDEGVLEQEGPDETEQEPDKDIQISRKPKRGNSNGKGSGKWQSLGKWQSFGAIFTSFGLLGFIYTIKRK